MMDDVFDPDVATSEKAYQKQIEDLVDQAQAGEQMRVILNSDVGREVRKHILIRRAELNKKAFELDRYQDSFFEQYDQLRFEHRVLTEVTNLTGLILAQSDEAIKQFEHLSQQRGEYEHGN